MRFQPGQSGNPAGRPPGSRNKETLEAEAMLAARAEATVAKILERADAGNAAAMRLCMERMAPTGASRPLPFEMPPVDTPDDVGTAARAVMKALGEATISAREAVGLLTVVERLARLAERMQHMRERHDVWWRAGQSDASLRENVRAALAGVLQEQGIEGEGLYSPVNSHPAGKEATGEALYSPVNSAVGADGEHASSPAGSGNGPASKERSAGTAASQTGRDGLYFPVNSESKPAAGKAPSGSILRGRRRALMASVSPKALLLGLQPVDPRSYVTDQTWLAEMLKNEAPGVMRRSAA